MNVVGLNTGAGGRWTSKQLSPERTLELARAVAEGLAARGARRPTFHVLGGPPERERNDALLRGLAADGLAAVDAGTDNPLLDFAAKVELCDVLVTSDSLALHVAVARRVRVVCFFAPTSAAEIELYGRGEKVASTAPDACSYRPDADTATLTVERLAPAVLRQLAEVETCRAS
jgi:heptosyltransferase-2